MTGRWLVIRPRWFGLAVRLIACGCLLALAGGCGGPEEDTGAVTRASIDSFEDGKGKLAAGDLAGAREAFAAAATGGGLQPDLYCEARLQQAICAARLGDREEALALLDELATGAPDLRRIERLRARIKAGQSGGDKAKAEDADGDTQEAGDGDTQEAESAEGDAQAAGDAAATP